MIIPNLIIPGAAKSGTSSLHNYLNIHPDITMSDLKEPQFFTLDARYELGLDYYNDIFPKSNNITKYYGESSTSYLPNKEAIDRINKRIKNVRLIIILRNPVRRTISHYKWLVSLGREHQSFRKAVIKNVKNGTKYKVPEYGGIWKGYYTSSLYGKQMEYLYKVFKKEQIFVITTEELSQNPLVTLNKCFDFLEVERLDEVPEVRTNVTLKRKEIEFSWNKLRKFADDFPSSILKVFRTFERITLNFFINRDHLINAVTKDDEKWLLQYFKDDIELFRFFHPEVLKKWSL